MCFWNKRRFFTHGGSGCSRTINTLETMQSYINGNEAVFFILQDQAKNNNDEEMAWLENIKVLYPKKEIL
jgi:hypothetical protein